MTKDGEQPRSLAVRPKGPFDLALSLEAAASFFPIVEAPPATLRTLVQTDADMAVVEVRQPARVSGMLRASSIPALEADRLRAVVKWLVSADLDLRPFYGLVAQHPVIGPAARSLSGLKPLRPATLFEMALIAITEQQLSIAAAFHVRSRLVRRFGIRVSDLWAFPPPARLAKATLRELCACGLSRRKSEYIQALATRITQNGFDIEALRGESDQRIREALLSIRGFGEWSVEYILGRGFGRPDCLPAGDVGLQRVVGHYMADGRRLAAAELEEALAPFKPFRGLAAYYLAVHWRLCRATRSRPMESA